MSVEEKTLDRPALQQAVRVEAAFSPWKSTGERTRRRAAVAAFLLLALAAWQFYSMNMPPVLMPSPARVADRFISMWSDAGFLSYALATLSHVVLAVAISFTVGVGIALLTYFFPVLNLAVYTRLAPFLNSFSGMGWAFLALIWFGITGSSVVFASSVALLPMAIINAGAGLRELNQETIEMSASFSRSSGRRTVLVILPMLFPYLFATLRLCFGIAWQIVIAAELLCGSAGLGAIINMARQRYWTDMIFAVALLILIAVVITDRVLFAKIQDRVRKRYEI